MLAEFISPDDCRWTDFLARVDHDSYHLPDYVSFAARQEGGRPCAFFAQRGDLALLVPLLLRPLPKNLQPQPQQCDALTPYGYPGPLLAGNPPQETVAEMLQAFVQLGRSNRIVSAFWRLHPLLPFPLGQLERLGALVHHGSTVYIDLTRSAEELRQQTSSNHRRGVGRLQKSGFHVVRNDWRHWQTFIDAYRQTMRRVDAGPFYYFSDGYFSDLRRTFGERLEFWTALSPENEAVAAALFMVEDGIVQYHLDATSDGFVAWSPIKLILAEVRSWAREAGHRILHLGGGLGGRSDSLFLFKAQFSSSQAPFHTFRAILLPKDYDALVARCRGARQGCATDHPGFFPAYRQPS